MTTSMCCLWKSYLLDFLSLVFYVKVALSHFSWSQTKLLGNFLLSAIQNLRSFILRRFWVAERKKFTSNFVWLQVKWDKATYFLLSATQNLRSCIPRRFWVTERKKFPSNFVWLQLKPDKATFNCENLGGSFSNGHKCLWSTLSF